MSDLHSDHQRAREAQSILENPLVIEAFDIIESNLLQAWKQSKASDKEGREEAWKMLKVLGEFKRHFESVIQNGKIAEHEIGRLEKLHQKVRNIF